MAGFARTRTSLTSVLAVITIASSCTIPEYGERRPPNDAGTSTAGEAGTTSAGGALTHSSSGARSAGEPPAGSSGEGGANSPPATAGAAGESEAAGGASDEIPRGPSCGDEDARCGGTAREDCCATLRVAGGEFSLGGRQRAPLIPAHVSGFYLDKYEVTAARFQRFVESYDDWHGRDGNPKREAGAHPLIPASGWREPSDALPASAAELEDKLRECPNSTWKSKDTLPINCLSWQEAFAFCIWDDARLPTEAEWEYATVGGSESRICPWGSLPRIDHAVFGCLDDSYPECAFEDIGAVGSKPLGAGRWGQLDLIGSMSEWTRDWYNEYPARCDDCANVVNGLTIWSGPRHVMRGGNWRSTESSDPANPGGYLSSVRRDYVAEDVFRFQEVGVRCARSAQPPTGTSLD